MLEIVPETRFVLSEEIIIQSLPELDHYYAFNINTGDHFQLNETAWWVLKQIIGGIAFSELSKRFSQNFDLSLVSANQDLTEAINYALDNKIIEEVQR